MQVAEGNTGMDSDIVGIYYQVHECLVGTEVAFCTADPDTCMTAGRRVRAHLRGGVLEIGLIRLQLHVHASKRSNRRIRSSSLVTASICVARVLENSNKTVHDPFLLRKATFRCR